MLGFDFSVFWQIGQAVLSGHNPYSVPLSVYPPMMTLVFSLFALVPFQWAFPIWAGLNFVLVLDVLRRLASRNYFWILFSPVVFTLMTGQIDLLFLWLASWTMTAGWQSIVCAALLTLKPQIALIVLPWLLIRWLRKSPRSVIYWILLTLTLHTLPLLYDRAIYTKWLSAVNGQLGWRFAVSSGVFSLTTYQVPVWILILISLAVAVWGLTHSEAISRSAMLLASPAGLWYDSVLLVGSGPTWLMISWSWVAFILAYLLKNSVPLASIPLVAFAWQAWTSISERKKLQLSAAN
jgi:hypothetical protein